MDFSVKTVDKRTWAIWGLVILLFSACIVAWYRGNHEVPTSKTEFIKTPEVKEAAKVPRVEIPVKKIVALEKKAAVKKLNLPPEIKDDPAKQITASGIVAPYEGKTDVLAIFDTNTGVSSIVAKQVPLPFLDFENHLALGIRSGASFKNDLETDGYVRWDFFRIASVHLGVYGEVNTTGDAKGMLQAEYRR